MRPGSWSCAGKSISRSGWLPCWWKKAMAGLCTWSPRTVKQPIPVLSLSNAMRAGVVGFAKSLATEIAPKGGYGQRHCSRLPRTRPPLNASSKRIGGIPGSRTMKPAQRWKPVFRSDAWARPRNWPPWRPGCFSPHAAFVTGQTISHDGGAIDGLFG